MMVHREIDVKNNVKYAFDDTSRTTNTRLE